MQNANQPRELRLITRDRKREFNDVRQSHSRRKELSQSQISKSVGKSRVNREFQNLREYFYTLILELPDSTISRMSNRAVLEKLNSPKTT